MHKLYEPPTKLWMRLFWAVGTILSFATSGLFVVLIYDAVRDILKGGRENNRTVGSAISTFFIVYIMLTMLVIAITGRFDRYLIPTLSVLIGLIAIRLEGKVLPKALLRGSIAFISIFGLFSRGWRRLEHAARAPERTPRNRSPCPTSRNRSGFS